MAMRLRTSSLLIVFLALGCAYARIDPRSEAVPLALDASAEVWVLTPKDGVYGSRPYTGSGQAVATRVLSILRSRLPLAQSLPGVDERVALEQARSKGIRYIVSPVILHWEDRATAWSGRRDKVRVEVRVVGVEPAASLLGRTVFESRNNSITLLDRRPEDLLDDDFAHAVEDLIGG